MEHDMIRSYIALDLETTGLNPKLDKIIEIGAVRVEEGVVTASFETLVNPGRRLEGQTIMLTGIQDEDLSGAPQIRDILPNLLAFMGDLPLLGHHIIFDYSFIKRAAVNMGLSFEREGMDTLSLARHLMPEEEKKNLKQACLYYDVKAEPSHRALADAKAAGLLYECMKKMHAETLPQVFIGKKLVYQVKKEQPASKRQKEHLQELVKYHKICLTVQIESLSRNEISRITDKIIAQYGRL